MGDILTFALWYGIGSWAVSFICSLILVGAVYGPGLQFIAPIAARWGSRALVFHFVLLGFLLGLSHLPSLMRAFVLVQRADNNIQFPNLIILVINSLGRGMITWGVSARFRDSGSRSVVFA